MPLRPSKNSVQYYKKPEQVTLTFKISKDDFEELKTVADFTNRDAGDLCGAFFASWVVPKVQKMLQKIEAAPISSTTSEVPNSGTQQTTSSTEKLSEPVRSDTKTNPSPAAPDSHTTDKPAALQQPPTPPSMPMQRPALIQNLQPADAGVRPAPAQSPMQPRTPQPPTQSQPPLRPTVPPTSSTTNPENS